LSYNPQNGWAFEIPGVFAGVSILPLANGRIPRDLAVATVWRWYRIKTPFTLSGYGNDFSNATVGATQKGAPPLPGSNLLPTNVPNPVGSTINNLRQILPIESEQVLVAAVPVDVVGADPGAIHNIPAEVYGIYFDVLQGQGVGLNTAAGTPYYKSFSIDGHRGIVIFSDVTFQRTPANGYSPAVLKLRTAVSVRDPNTWAWERMLIRFLYQDQSETGSGFRVLNHEEIWLNCAPSNKDKQGNTTSIITNSQRINEEAGYYFTAIDLEYQTFNPQNRLYPGLVSISTDGAIQQVTWNFGPSGATTRVSRNNEVDPAVPPYRERQFYESLRRDELRQVKEIVKNMAAIKINLPTQKAVAVVASIAGVSGS